MIGKKIKEIKYKSFYLDSTLCTKYIVFYLKFEAWYEIIISDGRSSIKKIDDSQLINSGNIKDKIFYPIYAFSEFKLDGFGKLIEVREYLLINNLEESIGYFFIFENDCFSIIENLNEMIVIKKGKDINRLIDFELSPQLNDIIGRVIYETKRKSFFF